ncbi:class II aldolase/adducin family protein [Sulfurisoma sediminicola]|uniref:L-fuculose 1-phosphate aldolase n=1 Tax=Sulfurisoma sediminicola TaxID=1381557 RepID=A0A497XK27_9PROT|nr:class II aldolase/adducin family protein [Sulfurisoma sediminicola]RLJ67747.1 L-fuculose 1-phosphate aldolase [Sulfurisoma sediminicola]
MADPDPRAAVLATARAMNGAGLNRGTAGNVSVRHGQGFLVTPTGMDYDESVPEDIAFVGPDYDGGRAEGRRKPSSEWRFHRDIYAARPEAGAIIHTHAPFATALACRGEAIPPFHYMIARFGGADIRCADYATFGTQELSDAVVKALEGRSACLMAHHGMVVFGRDLKQSLALAVEFEALCEQYWRVLALGQARTLLDDEMQRVIGKFGDYGRQD